MGGTFPAQQGPLEVSQAASCQGNSQSTNKAMGRGPHFSTLGKQVRTLTGSPGLRREKIFSALKLVVPRNDHDEVWVRVAGLSPVLTPARPLDIHRYQGPEAPRMGGALAAAPGRRGGEWA